MMIEEVRDCEELSQLRSENKALKEQLAADVEPVVRCGECKYSKFSRTQTQRYTCDYTYSPCRGRCMDADFGCLYGERKDDSHV